MKPHVLLKPLSVLWALTAGTPFVEADVRLPNIFADHMVLQQGQPIPVWGWADPGEKVRVTLGDEQIVAKAGPDGCWSVKLPARKASTGLTLIAAGTIAVTLRNVAVGEVWFCSGQSNMDWQVRNSERAEEAIARANYPHLRLFKVRHQASALPKRDCSGSWEVCTPETVPEFSAVGFYFGERLHRELKVPVGLIKSAWGGTRIEPWTPREAYAGKEAFEKQHSTAEKASQGFGEALANYDLSLVETWLAAARKAVAERTAVPKFPALPKHDLYQRGHPRNLSVLYNAMVRPVVPYGIRGAIWYQGESNRGDGMLYYDRMKALIESWREAWGQGARSTGSGQAFPFYYVQLAPCAGFYGPTDLPKLWEAQARALTIPKTGMAVTTDIATVDNIHPPNKSDVGHRLARWALTNDYGHKGIAVSGPIYKSMQVQGSEITVSFDHTVGGLASLDGKPLTDFMLAGEDQQFYNAEARIAGPTVVVSSPEVPQPVHVRFGWNQTAEPNFGNGAKLPASPFRSDDWEVPSYPRLGPWMRAAGEWSVSDGLIAQASQASPALLFIRNDTWKNYTLELEAKKTGGSEGFLILFRVNSRGRYWWNAGGWGNSKCCIQPDRTGGKRSPFVPGTIETEKWYKIKIVVEGDTFECYLDGKLTQTHKDDFNKTGAIGVGTWRTQAQYRNLRVTAEDGTKLFEF